MLGKILCVNLSDEESNYGVHFTILSTTLIQKEINK